MLKLLAIVSLSLALFTGCNTPPTTVAYRVEGVVITTVDKGMNAWRDYVVAGFATKAQVLQVKDAYDKYYNAQLLARAAFEKAMAEADSATAADEIATANKAVADAESALLSLIQSFLNKTNIPKVSTTPD